MNVDVWYADLDRLAYLAPSLAGLLNSDARERTSRYWRHDDRARFTVVHGILRSLLSLYTGQAPQDLCLRSGPDGKPEVDGPITFNMSSTTGLALYAFTSAACVGVDVERVREDMDYEEIAQLMFSSEERALLQRSTRRAEIFFRLWTRREAYLKATGLGLAACEHPVPMPSFGGAARWSMYRLALPVGWVGSLAIGGPRSVAVRMWAFQPEGGP